MIGLIKNYIEKRIDLLKIETAESSVKVLGLVVYILLLATLGICVFAFLCIGLGLVIGRYIEDYAMGMFAVSGIFLFFFLVILLAKKGIVKFLKRRILDIIFNGD